MLSAHRFYFVILMCITLIGLTGCVTTASTDLVSRTEKFLNKSYPGDYKNKFNLGVITIFDSENKKIRFITRESEPNKDTESSFRLRLSDNALENEAASEIKELSMISVLGLAGVKVNNEIYGACKYISIDNQVGTDFSQLICRNDDQDNIQANLTTTDLKVLDSWLLDELQKVSGIEKIGFVVFNDYKSGQAELFLAKRDYFSPSTKVSFPIALSTDTKRIKSLNTWTMITYRQNPCKVCSTNGGKTECTYYKDETNCK